MCPGWHCEGSRPQPPDPRCLQPPFWWSIPSPSSTHGPGLAFPPRSTANLAKPQELPERLQGVREGGCLGECLDLPNKEHQFGLASKPMAEAGG